MLTCTQLTASSPTIESLQDWVWRVLGTSFVVKVLLWWIFLSKFLCAYIDEPACAHTSRFINSGVSNPADNGCNWTMVQQCNSSKILAKLLQQLLNRWLLHFHSRQVERFPNWQFIIKIETSLGPLLLHASVLRQAGSALFTPLWISLLSLMMKERWRHYKRKMMKPRRRINVKCDLWGSLRCNQRRGW